MKVSKEQLENLSVSLNLISAHVWAVAKSKGFKDDPVPVAVSCSNLHGEVSELWEAYRTNNLDKPCDKSEKMEKLGLPVLTCAEEELADILIRVLDTAKDLNIDIGRALAVKDAFNQTREERHGNKKA